VSANSLRHGFPCVLDAKRMETDTVRGSCAAGTGASTSSGRADRRPPLNVEPVETDLSREETVQAVRESRERSAPGERPQ